MLRIFDTVKQVAQRTASLPRGLWPIMFVLFVTMVSGVGCSQGECRFDSDCPDDKICKAGVCTTNLLDKPCRTDSDCDTSETCLAASCVKVECEEGAQRDCFEGPAGTLNVGICRGGKQQCQGRRWSACNGQILPVQEVCNQQDDDCNGQVDDDSKCQAACQDGQTRPCYTGPTGTQDIGVCRKGTESCTNGAWSGQCDGQITPTSKDVCDDKQDNNCNGQVDEGCGPCKAGDSRACYSGPPNTKSIGECKDGTQSCQNGQWGLCINDVKPSPEVCDNKDNDCNGKVDDDPKCQAACQDGKTRPCYNGPPGTQGVGICKAGVEVCQGGKWSTTCTGVVTPGSEKCDDKLDNNCNGQTDENCGVCRSGDQEVCFTGSSGCSKQSDGSYRCNTPCRAGIRSCSNGQWGACSGETTPKPSETCNNNIDDDCNGKVDDGCGCQNGQTQSCYNGPAGTSGKGVCKAGQQTCNNGTWGNCVGEVRPGGEICNDGKDNNCDGQTDENCQSAGNLHKSCKTDTECGSGLVCIGFQGQASGVCFQNCSSSAAVCSSNGDGRKKCMAFAQTQQGQTISVCVKEVGANASCDVTKSVVCSTGNACAGGTCKPVQTASEGQECNPQAATPVLCGSNLTCVSFGTGFPSICLKNCTAGNATSCGSGFTCITLSGGSGACLATGCSTTNQNCSYAFHTCINDTTLNKTACYPQPSPGPLTFGKKCNPSVPAERCQRGLTCLGLTGATHGFCTVDCTSSNTCPSSPRGATCVTTNGNQKSCLFACNSCPTGLKCNTSVNYCFP